MLDAGLDFFHRQAGAELEDLDMRRFYQGPQGGEINRAGAGSTMVAAGKLYVVDVKAKEAITQGLKVHRVVDEAEVLFNLGMAGVVPINQGRAGNFAEQELVIAFDGQLFEGLAVFDAQFKAAALGVRRQFLE